jgi:6-phospho-beta-galactosidase
MVAHAKALNLYKSMNLPGRIGIVHTLEGKEAITDTPENNHARDLDDAISNRFMLDACYLGRYSETTMGFINEILQKNGGSLLTEEQDFVEFAKAAAQIDFLGMNYYSSHFLQAYEGESQVVNNSTGEKGTSVFCLKGIGARVSNPAVPTTDWDWPIYPEGMYKQLKRIARDYPNYKEIFISENGMGYKDDFVDGKIDDTPRIEYVTRHLEAVLKAISEGVHVGGYYIWSLMDVLSWSNGYNKRYGLFYVDYATQKRYPKKSAYWYKAMSQRGKIVGVDDIAD